MPCIDEQMALIFSDGALTGSAAEAVRAHIGECDACFQLVGACLAPESHPSNLAVASSLLEPGTLLDGKYTIQARIGEGAFGVVYRALPAAAPDAAVAIKVFTQSVVDDAGGLRRAAAEIEIGKRLSSPYVCRVLDSGSMSGRPYLVLELAERSLRDELVHHWGEKTLGSRLLDALTVTRGLAAVHAAGLLHRDLKPENVLRMGDARLVVSDFGLSTHADARGDRGGTLGVGTPAYMAPEQRSAPADRASDVYALGVVLHELVFGRRPARERGAIVRPHAVTTPERELFALCEDCLADAPEKRPRVRRVQARLDRIARGKTSFPMWALPTAIAVGAVSFAIARGARSPVPTTTPVPARTIPSVPPASSEPPVLAASTAHDAAPPAGVPSVQPPHGPGKPSSPLKPSAWYAGSTSPGYPAGRLRERVLQILPAIERCYSPHSYSPVDHHYCEWAVSVDGSGAVTSVWSINVETCGIPRLSSCVKTILGKQLRMDAPEPPAPVTLEVYIGAHWPPGSRPPPFTW